jgi:hypothetical protein
LSLLFLDYACNTAASDEGIGVPLADCRALFAFISIVSCSYHTDEILLIKKLYLESLNKNQSHNQEFYGDPPANNSN